MPEYAIKPIIGAEKQPTECRVLSVTLGGPYDAVTAADFHGPDEVDAFIETLQREAKRLWPRRNSP